MNEKGNASCLIHCFLEKYIILLRLYKAVIILSNTVYNLYISYSFELFSVSGANRYNEQCTLYFRGRFVHEHMYLNLRYYAYRLVYYHWCYSLQYMPLDVVLDSGSMLHILTVFVLILGFRIYTLLVA